MIVVKLKGGLGNQMFQYALGRRLAEKHCVSLKLDLSSLVNNEPLPGCTHRKYELDVFNIKADVANREDVSFFFEYPKVMLKRILRKVELKVKPRHIIRETSFSYFPGVIWAGARTYLDGYWQSERYFKDIAPTIRQELTFKIEPNKTNQQMAERIQSVNAVSLHIRRGDYITDAITNDFHGTCSFAYYQSSLQEILKKEQCPHFFVFSDDPIWAKDNIYLNHPTVYVDHNQNNSNYEDLRLMSLCKHNIIANSSFSWWAAWLNSNPCKMVVAPLKWYNDLAVDTQDLIPSDWIRV